MVNPIKKLIKHVIGRNGYAILINTKIGSKLHDGIHSKSPTSRDFLLQALPKFSIGVEIGVDDGNFSERILEIVRPKMIHLIDPWKFNDDDAYSDSPYGNKKVDGQKMMDQKYHMVKKRFEDLINRNQVMIHRGFSEKVCEKFKDNYFDWVYIDGNHFYESVKNDLNLYYPKIKLGGFITGDDYYENDVSGKGVKKAVDEFVNTGLVKIMEIKNNQFILQKTSLL